MLKLNLLFLIMMMTTILDAQTPTKEQLAVQKTIENMFTALSQADTVALKLYMTDNVNFFEYGQIWNRDTIVHKAMLGKAIPDFNRINSFQYVPPSGRKRHGSPTIFNPPLQKPGKRKS